mgnify:CR=1 FL=1
METPSIRQEQTLSAYYGLAAVVICVIVVDVAETDVELLFTLRQVIDALLAARQLALEDAAAYGARCGGAWPGLLLPLPCRRGSRRPRPRA